MALTYMGAYYLEMARAYEPLALEYLNNVMENNPKNALALALLGQYHVKQKSYSQALGCLNKAIELDPNNSSAYVFRGECCLQQHYLKAALENFDKAIEINPRDTAALEGRSRVLYKSGYECEAVVLEFKAHEISRKYKIPTLLSLCKQNFFRSQSSICARGDVFRMKASEVRATLVNNHITPNSLESMNWHLKNGFKTSGLTIFEQLDKCDIEDRANTNKRKAPDEADDERAIKKLKPAPCEKNIGNGTVREKEITSVETRQKL